MLSLLLLIRLTGTIDRIEDEWAVIEWSNGSFSDVPTQVFPRDPFEGEKFQVRVRQARSGGSLGLPGRPPPTQYLGRSSGASQWHRCTARPPLHRLHPTLRDDRLSVPNSTKSKRT